MRATRALLTIALGLWALPGAQAQAPGRPSYLVGSSGWTSDTAGTGLVTLRTSVIPRRGLPVGEQPGTVLFLCSMSEDKMIVDPVRGSSFRSVEPSGTGTAYIAAMAPGGGESGPKLFGAVKTFPGGAFEITDMPTAERNTTRALVAQIAAGATRFRFTLSAPVPAGFQRDQAITMEFVVAKSAKPELQHFDQACQLLGYRR
jgi:hypothetical protein